MQAVKTGYTKSHQSKKSLKVVNNAPTIEPWRSLTCKNCQPYYWDEHHASISPLILMTDLNNSYPLLPEDVSFLECFNGLASIVSDISITLKKSHETIFVDYFWKVTNTCKRYFWDVSEMSQNRHLFWDMVETS